MKALLGDEQVTALRQHCFFEKQFADGGQSAVANGDFTRRIAGAPHLLST